MKLEGYLDAPQPDDPVRGTTLSLRGWLFSRDSPIKELILKAPGVPARRISLGLPRADVSKAFPRNPAAANAGFEEQVALGRTRGAAHLELWALLESGQRVLAFKRRVVLSGGARFGARDAGEFLRSAAQKGVRALKEGRLSASPVDWLRKLKLQYHETQTEAGPTGARSAPSAISAAPALAPAGADAKQVLTALSKAALRAFLDSGGRLAWPAVEEPAVSVILVLYNRAELTLRCLRSLRSLDVPIELIVVDNASSDDTRLLLDRLDGARVIRNPENVGFLLAVNRAAALARGRHLLLLNNDAELFPGSLESAVRVLDGAPDAGAVGGKLILPDGSLQEAGSIIWSDGSCAGYGRGDSPFQPIYAFARDVDYCSGAFLLTPRALWESLGGFDEDFQPAYYEDADYCVRVWKAGKRVVYDPGAVALHYEFASSGTRAQAIKMQSDRRALFAAKHAEWLTRQPSLERSSFVLARARPSSGKNILFLDDRVPHARHGSGHPRARDLLQALVDRGHRVTFYPTTFPESDWSEVYRDLPREVEVMLGFGAAGLGAFLEERSGFYHRVIVSRPHNMQLYRSASASASARVIYDAEAIFAVRDAQQDRILRGKRISDDELARRVAEETALAHGADVVLSVSKGEGRQFQVAGFPRVFTLGHALTPTPTKRAFSERAGILFVGAFYKDSSPNSDSLFWFAREVWPRVRRALGEDAWLTVAGARPTARIMGLAGPGVEVLGEVDDLTPLYDRARVLVAPTRFAAGVPYKVHHAAAHGLPVVATPLLATQLGWQHDEELLAAAEPADFAEGCRQLYTDAALWERLRQAALARVREDCSPAAFAETLEAALDACLVTKRDE